MGGDEEEGQGYQGAGEERRQRGENGGKNGGKAGGNEILRARLERLTGALDAQRRERQAQAQAPGDGPNSPPGALGTVLSMAFRVLSEFVAAVLVGTAIGWGIDRAAGSSPVFLIVFVLLGAAAGLWNVYRIGTGTPGAEGK